MPETAAHNILLANLDLTPLKLKQWVTGLFAAEWQGAVSILLSIIALMATFSLLFALVTILERKGLGRIQNRPGPNRVGPFGLLQPVADGIKLLVKEDIIPRRADRVIHFLAPIVLVAPVMLAFAVIPYGPGLAAVDLDAGVLFFFAVSAASELSVFMAGWAGRNKYSMLGALRAIAQMISYELPLILSTVTVIMMSGSMSLTAIVGAQADYWGWIPLWHVLTPWGMAGFALFMIAAVAESNRSPFDLPEAESEIIAGFLTEYSGFKYALFFMGEYFGIMAASGLAITLFLGGWHAPLPFLGWIPGFAWFFAKLFALIFLFIWSRGTLPRLRIDQLMNFAWTLLLPLALINIAVAVVWRYLALVGGAFIGWLMCAALIGLSYVWLSRARAKKDKIAARVYRLAD